MGYRDRDTPAMTADVYFSVEHLEDEQTKFEISRRDNTDEVRWINVEFDRAELTFYPKDEKAGALFVEKLKEMIETYEAVVAARAEQYIQTAEEGA